jgi:hypothetical protein
MGTMLTTAVRPLALERSAARYAGWARGELDGGP